ncbi:MAG: hypothetical protein OXI63_21435, partial [Candidatus Poribacteria bacterium]|nr:hypothetical protein [Candidatus Poribacteria bacterium]
ARFLDAEHAGKQVVSVIDEFDGIPQVALSDFFIRSVISILLVSLGVHTALASSGSKVLRNSTMTAQFPPLIFKMSFIYPTLPLNR